MKWPCAVLAAVVLVVPPLSGTHASARDQTGLPSRLSDKDFWNLSVSFSEPGGTFQSDNLVSNETGYAHVLGELMRRHQPGGAYLGVGPEQNFSYIAALKPAVAFIVDVRRENRDLHLMYKALFELASNRVEFASLLFARLLPSSLGKDATATEIATALDSAPIDTELLARTGDRLIAQLAGVHRFALSAAELDHIRAIHSTFAAAGPTIGYATRVVRGLTITPTVSRVAVPYSTLMRLMTDDGTEGSYLATEARYATVQDLEIRNLIVPVVGNFAGEKAIRSVAAWLTARHVIVSAFYLSNVEDYLQGPLMTAFCQNAASLPVDDLSDFIRSGGSRSVGMTDPGRNAPFIPGLRNNRIGGIKAETSACAR